MYYLGFDIGGSSVKAALVKDKKIIKSDIQDLPDDLAGLLDLTGKMFADLTNEIQPEEIGGVGFAIAGAIDISRETMLHSPNIPYLNNQPVRKLLAEKVAPHPIKIEHDVYCFLLAEKEIGLAKNLKNVFYLTLGTGIGGAFMLDGKIFSGSHGAAGEAGHMIVNFQFPISNFQNNEIYDLEELASNKFIKKNLGVGSIEAFRRAQAGDEEAIKVFGQLGANLGLGLANIINIFDPEAIILSGGICEAKEFISPFIKEGIDRYVISPAAKETRVLFSQLGREAGALGAALMCEN